jgi:hypothetical protein
MGRPDRLAVTAVGAKYYSQYCMTSNAPNTNNTYVLVYPIFWFAADRCFRNAS